MVINVSPYNDFISARRESEQKAAKEFAQIVQLIESGDCFFIAINGYADGNNVGYLDRKAMDNYYEGGPVTLKFIQVVDITNVGVDCLIATVEGIWDTIISNIQVYKITWNREIYPSFVDVLYLKWELFQFDGSSQGWSDAKAMYAAVQMYQDLMQQEAGSIQTRGGVKGNTEGAEPTHFDVSIYTGNDVEISSQFENYKEHPDDENPDDPENPEDSEPENTEDPEPEDPKGSGDQR
jgi:hypothetical protein